MTFLIVALFTGKLDFEKQKIFRVFMVVYNIGVPLMAVMMLVQGVIQVLNIPLSTGGSAAISGIAGIGHILVGTGIVLLLMSLKKAKEV